MRLVKDCTACLISGKAVQPISPQLQPVPWPSHPREHLQLDICGEIWGVPHHQRYLVVTYGLHSKWLEVVPVGSVTSQTVIHILDTLLARWVPQAITTDNDPQFISVEFTYLIVNGIKHIHLAVYHPQANGGVERFNQTLKHGI